MSIKIYFAWRCTPTVFSEKFLPQFRKHCFRRIKKRLNSIITSIAKPREKLIAALSEIISSKSDFFDCSLNVWLYKQKVYIIPYCEWWMHKDFEIPIGVEEYSYYNSADKPKEVSRRSWKLRRDNWDEICKMWSSRLQHIIFEAKTEMGIDHFLGTFYHHINVHKILYLVQKNIREFYSNPND